MSSLDIAPHPEGAPTRVRDQRRTRHRLRVSFRRAGNCTIWRLGFRQFSFHHIARVPRRAVPDTWTRPPVSCHALVPLTFRRQVRHRTQGHPSNPSRLRRGYNEAPRGAPLICRVELVVLRWLLTEGGKPERQVMMSFTGLPQCRAILLTHSMSGCGWPWPPTWPASRAPPVST